MGSGNSRLGTRLFNRHSKAELSVLEARFPVEMNETEQRSLRLTRSVFGLYIPSSFFSCSHFASTISFVARSDPTSSGHGRVNPSVGHFRVASIPIFDPKSGSRDEWSNESTGPS